MSRYSDQVRDEYGRSVPGVSIYVYVWDAVAEVAGDLDALTDDLSASLANPLTSDADGLFYFNAVDGQKLLEYHYGGKVQFRDLIQVGPVPVPQAVFGGLFVDAHLLSIPTGMDMIGTTGYAALGVGAANYIYDATVDAAYVLANPRTSFISANSRGFRLDHEQDFAITMFGAACDTSSAGVGGTDDTTAVQAAITYAAALGGGTLHIPGHTKCASSLSLAALHNIRLVGPSGTGAGGTAPPPAQLLYTGAGARFIDARSSFAVEVSDLAIRNTNPAFTGWLIDFDHSISQDSAYGLVTRCLLGGISGSVVGSKCINFNNSIIHRVIDNNFQNYDIGIKGGGGSYSNSITIENNTFGAHGTAAIMNAVQMWTVQNNTFEAGPRAYYDDQVGGATSNLSWLNNWHGDGTAVGANTWMSFGTTIVNGLLIAGNYFDTSFTNVACIKLNGPAQGVEICGNSFVGAANSGINFGSVAHYGVHVSGNFWVAEPINIHADTADLWIANNKKDGGFAKSYFRMSTSQEVRYGDRNASASGPGIIQLNAPTATDSVLELNGDGTQYRATKFRTAGVERVRLGLDTSSAFGLICYDAGGAFVGYGLTVTPATMAAAFGGALSAPSAAVTGALTSSGGGVGYATGAGGTVTQITSRTTGVTLNKLSGAITLFSAAGTATWQTFTVTNSQVAVTDVIRVVQKSGADKNMIHVTAVAAGSFDVTFATTGGTTTEQPVFNFAVIKGVAA